MKASLLLIYQPKMFLLSAYEKAMKTKSLVEVFFLRKENFSLWFRTGKQMFALFSQCLH